MDFVVLFLKLLPTLEPLALVLVANTLVSAVGAWKGARVEQTLRTLVFAAAIAWVICHGIDVGLPDRLRYDARFPVLIAAVFFLGCAPSAVVLIAGMAARAWVGGASTGTGLVVMFLVWLAAVWLAQRFRFDATDVPVRNQVVAVASATLLAGALPFVAPFLGVNFDEAVDRVLLLGPAWGLVQMLGVVCFAGILLLYRQRLVQQTELTQSRGWLSSLLDALPDNLLVQAADGRLEQALGPRDERSSLIRHLLQEGLPKDARDVQVSLIRRALQEQALARGQLSLEHAGEVLHLDLRVVPLPSGQALSLVQDVSAAQRGVEELRARTSHLQAVLESTEGLWGTVDREGVVTPMNSRWLSMAGYTESDLKTRPLPGLLSDHVEASVVKALRDVRAGRLERYQMEATMRRKDGTSYWADLLLSPLSPRSPGATEDVLVYVSDATQRKGLQAQQELADKVLHSLPDGVVVLRAADGVVEWVNDGFTRMTGYEEAEVLGLSLQRVLGSVVPRNVTQPELTAQWQGRWKGEFFSRRKDGTWFPEEREVHGFDDGLRKEVRQVAILRDLTRERQGSKVAQNLTRRDELTSLPNRARFIEKLREAIQALPEQRDPQEVGGIAVFCLDLKHFSNINKSLGRDVGDLLLQHVALGMGTLLAADQALSRVEADEFAWMSPHRSAEDDEGQAQRILTFFKQSVLLGGHEVYVDANVGIGIARVRGQTAESVLHQAHLALEEVALRGGSQVGHYNEAISTSSQRGMALETGLRKALADAPHELYLEFQPKVALGTGRVLGFEALCRWQSATLGRVGPFEFIPVAEQCGLIRTLGLRVFEAACQQLAQWRSEGLELRPVAVNLSVQQLREASLVSALTALTRKHEVEPSLLELEVTESALMQNTDEAIALLSELRLQGFRISLDDFGTGYSSMAYLQRLPLDVLKLDRSFVKPLGSDSESEVICKAILALASQLSLFTVAEGVETEVQREFLRDNGCDALQGYLFSPPVPAEKAAQFLR